MNSWRENPVSTESGEDSGRYSDGNGGYQLNTPGINATGIRIFKLHGVPGIEIAWNQIINEPYKSRTEDIISVLDSSGTPLSPILVHNNYVQGGYAVDPTKARELGFTGSGITTDGTVTNTTPSLATGYVKFYSNQVVSVMGAGIQVALGHDVEVYENRIVSSGQLTDGTVFGWMGRGVNSTNYRNDPPGVYGNISIHDNLSGYRNYQLHIDGWQWSRQDYWFLVQPTVSFNNVSWSPATPDAPTLADEANEWVLWNQRLASAGQTVGIIAPGAPTNVSAVAGDGSITVSFAAPASISSVAIAGYSATCTSSNGGTPGSNTGVNNVLSIVVGGLTNGKSYTCTVTASAVGSWPASVPSNVVIPATLTSGSDCLFNWGEDHYPTLLSPSRPTSKTSAPYYYRYYSGANSYLGISSTDQHLYYLAASSGDLLDLGLATTWMGTAGCQ